MIKTQFIWLWLDITLMLMDKTKHILVDTRGFYCSCEQQGIALEVVELEAHTVEPFNGKRLKRHFQDAPHEEQIEDSNKM